MKTVCPALLLTSSLALQPALCEVSDYLPMNTGNSWNYVDWDSGGFDGESWWAPEIVVSITDTVALDGNTYYAFSPRFASVPSIFINGKNMRWKGSELMVHDGTTEYSIFRFPEGPLTEEPSTGSYVIDPVRTGGFSDVEWTTYFDPSNGLHSVGFTLTGVDPTTEVELDHRVRFVLGFGLTRWVAPHPDPNHVPFVEIDCEWAKFRILNPERYGLPAGDTDVYTLILTRLHLDVGFEYLGILTGLLRPSWGQLKAKSLLHPQEPSPFPIEPSGRP